jgi:hypothetical protein
VVIFVTESVSVRQLTAWTTGEKRAQLAQTQPTAAPISQRQKYSATEERRSHRGEARTEIRQ